MGSRPRHSSGQSAASPRARKGKRPATRRKPSEPPDIDAMLGRFSDAMSVIATATSAMLHAEHIPGGLKVQDIGDELVTLESGLRALRGVYDELDIAIWEVRS